MLIIVDSKKYFDGEQIITIISTVIFDWSLRSEKRNKNILKFDPQIVLWFSKVFLLCMVRCSYYHDNVKISKYMDMCDNLKILTVNWVWVCDEDVVICALLVFLRHLFLLVHMMTSSNGNIFHITGPLWREFTSDWWIPLTKASDAELGYFLWSAPEQIVQANNRDPCDLRCHLALYDVTLMNVQ